VIVISVTEAEYTGHGEGVPIARYSQSAATVLARIQSIRTVRDLNRDNLQQLLPPGAARNALDCALWDLEAKRSGKRVWELANIPIMSCSRRSVGDAHASHSEAATPREPNVDQVETSFTISLDTPEKMAAGAKAAATKPILKLKLGGENLDLSRVQAVHAGAPNARLLIDANESWSPEHYRKIVPAFQELAVELIEQPFPADADEVLETLDHPIPVCADESCHTTADLP